MSTVLGGGRLTPVRRQYLTIKHSYPDAVVLFRMGDFYECFDDDARTLSSALEIALTSRTMGKDTRVPMAGVPAVSLESNLARLIKQGHKVAICEQLSDPATSKGLVERGVVRVVTPGTIIEAALLNNQANNYLAAVCLSEGQAGLAYVDVTTGEFAVCQLADDQLLLEIARLQPSEILVPDRERFQDFVASATSAGEAVSVTQLETSAFSLRRSPPRPFGLLRRAVAGSLRPGTQRRPYRAIGRPGRRRDPAIPAIYLAGRAAGIVARPSSTARRRT